MTTSPVRPLTVADLRVARAAGRRLVMATAYDHPSAKLADEAGIDLLLVGDSAAMVVLGRDSTVRITLDEMTLFTEAVSRGATRAIVVADMPFMTYQPSDADAVRSAGQLIARGGADAVKLEGGGRMVDRVRAITDSGVAVVGHLGLTPQAEHALGGFRAQARTAVAAQKLLLDARALEQAGAVALVLEAVPAEVASLVTGALSIPTIGIGAGGGTTGQVLVWHDLLGLAETPPPFVRRYADLATPTIQALREFAEDVRGGAFPAAEHVRYSMPEEELAELHELLEPMGIRVIGGAPAAAVREV